MKGILIYDPILQTFEVEQHNLSHRSADAIARRYQAEGRQAYAFEQAGKHSGRPESCELCAREGGLFLERTFRAAPERARPKPITVGDTTFSAEPQGETMIDEGAAEKIHTIKKLAPFITGVLVIACALFLLLGPLSPVIQKALEALSVPPTLPAYTPYVSSTPEAAEASLIENEATATIAPSLTPTQKPTPTRTTAPTYTATATSEISTTLELTATVAAEAQAGPCVPAENITLDDVGKETCIEGTVKRFVEDDTLTYVVFTDRYGEFYLVSFIPIPAGVTVGICVQASGEIAQLGTAPIMKIDWANPIIPCP